MKFLRKLFYGGTALAPHELAIVASCKEILPKYAEVIEGQRASIAFLQRFHRGRMVHMYFDPGFAGPFFGFCDTRCIAEVLVGFDSFRIRCKVMVHKGMLSSLEFSSCPPKKKDKFIVLSVVEPSRSISLDRFFDDEEHGKK